MIYGLERCVLSDAEQRHTLSRSAAIFVGRGAESAHRVTQHKLARLELRFDHVVGSRAVAKASHRPALRRMIVTFLEE